MMMNPAIGGRACARGTERAGACDAAVSSGTVGCVIRYWMRLMRFRGMRNSEIFGLYCSVARAEKVTLRQASRLRAGRSSLWKHHPFCHSERSEESLFDPGAIKEREIPRRKPPRNDKSWGSSAAPGLMSAAFCVSICGTPPRRFRLCRRARG